MEGPTATLTVDEMAVVVPPVRPQPRDPACLAMLPPQCRIDQVDGIERRDDDISDAGVTVRMTRLTCKFASPI
jgi:hypothetical protein